MTKYAGTKAVVINGLSGVGLAIAKRLVKGGADVLLTGTCARQAADAAPEAGSSAHVIRCDPAHLNGNGAMAATIAATLGGIDALFVDVGVVPSASASSLPEDDKEWSDSSIKDAYVAIRPLIPLLKLGGSIVVIASGVTSATATGRAVQAMITSAISSLVETFAAELRDRHVKVNAITAGHVAAPGCTVPDLGPPDEIRRYGPGHASSTVCRRGTVDEVTVAVLSLVTDAASTSAQPA